MNRGIIYILTNTKFVDNVVKIGKTQKTRLEKRIQELNRQTGVPFPFVCHAAFEIDNYDMIEKIVHVCYRSVGANTDEENTRKEFFEVNPEKARELLLLLSELHNGKEVFIKSDKTYTASEVKEIKEQAMSMQKNSRTKFENIDVPIGSELLFTRGDKKCIVIENNKVLYNNEEFSLSGLTSKLMYELGLDTSGRYNGYMYWKYNGEILSERRVRLEQLYDKDNN